MTMGVEIERKFLVKSDADFKKKAESAVELRQGYLSESPEATVRVRIAAQKAFITVKSRNKGISRGEWEYEIPCRDAEELLSLPGVRSLHKTRYVVPSHGHRWEVDEFHGPLEGLVIAEVELTRVDEPVELPDFIDREVTGDPRYYNSNLVRDKSGDVPVPSRQGEG